MLTAEQTTINPGAVPNAMSPDDLTREWSSRRAKEGAGRDHNPADHSHTLRAGSFPLAGGEETIAYVDDLWPVITTAGLQKSLIRRLHDSTGRSQSPAEGIAHRMCLARQAR
jgi:hypothetical protein